MQKQNFGSFYRFVMNSLDGHTEHYHSGIYVLPALIALVLWLLIGASGLHQVYQRLGMMGSVINTFVDSEKTFQAFKESEQFAWPEQKRKEEADKFLWPWQTRKEEKISPFFQVILSGAAAIFVSVIFLGVMSKIAQSQAMLGDAFITVGSCSAPLTVGMIFSYCLFKFAESVTGDTLPGILYMAGILFMAAAMMTSLIILYVNVYAILEIKERKRYFTTILTSFLAIGTFAWVSHLLIS